MFFVAPIGAGLVRRDKYTSGTIWCRPAQWSAAVLTEDTAMCVRTYVVAGVGPGIDPDG